jgi:protease I
MDNLEGLKVAILVTDGFEQVELLQPRQALDEAGADTQVVSPKDERVRGWNFTDWGDEVAVDLPLSRARPQDFDALLLPGGVINPDTLRMLPDAVAFVQAFFDEGKPVASICPVPGW